MKLFLASSVNQTIQDIAQTINIKPYKDLLFISTASETEKDPWWVQKDIDALKGVGFEVEQYTFTGKTKEQIQEKLATKKSLCVGGGNTYFLLQEMHKSDAFNVVQEAVKNDLLYFGSSAGSIVATKSIDNVADFDDPSRAPELKSFEGMNLVDLCLFVHWGDPDLEKDGERTTKIIQKYFTSNEKIVLLRNNQYIEVQDNFYRIVTV